MMVHSVGKGIGRIGRWMTDVTCFAASVVWNCCWLLFSLAMAGAGLFCLYGLGILAVLLTQGYPLTGVTLGCLGLVMCTFSASVIGVTFLRRRTKNAGGEHGFKTFKRNRGQNMKGPADGTGESGNIDLKDVPDIEEEGAKNQMEGCSGRGGEAIWVNCGV